MHPGRSGRSGRTWMAVVLAVAMIVLAAPPGTAQTPSPEPSSSASPSPSASAEPSPSGSPGASPSPTTAPEPEGPSIAFLNPSPGYDPGLDPADDGTPKISDKPDGIDALYHVVAAVHEAPPNTLVEVGLTYPDENEVIIGTLERVSPTGDTWEFYWDIPESFPEGPAVMSARLYEATVDGFVERSVDEVDVEMRHKAPSVPTSGETGADDSVAITWPAQGGQLGFYKPRGGQWRTAIDGSASAGTQWVGAFYTASPPGTKPEYVACGDYDIVPQATPLLFQMDCSLKGEVLPADVTAVALVAEGTPDASTQNAYRTEEAADVERITPYVQTPGEMKIAVTPYTRGVMAPLSPTHFGCLMLSVKVTDAIGRPVEGANIDVHATGPDDQLGFAMVGSVSSSQRAPDQGGHQIESSYTCVGGVVGEQGTHRTPSAPDTIHRESTQGSGVSGPQDIKPGEWRFHLYSNSPGFAKVTVWVDDEEVADITKTRPLDSDALDPDEPSATALAQWYPTTTPRVTVDPFGSSVGVGVCTPYVVKVAAGTDPLPGANVDVHATGPSDDLDFCDPLGASPRRAPDSHPAPPGTAHDDEDAGESSHAGTTNSQTQTTGPRTQHTEGEADEFGNFVIGLTSPVRGDTTIVAWFDGEKGVDNDEQRTGEPLGSATTSWTASTLEDAQVSFVNPSRFGAAGTGGPGNGTQLPDRGGEVRVMVRVDAPDLVPGVELLISADQKKTFSHLADMTRVENTDLYEFDWPVDRADGIYALRAVIRGTSIAEDIDVKVGAGEQLPMVPNPPYETLELKTPQPASIVPFDRAKTSVTGVASAGAEGVDIFYTKVAANVTPKDTDWIFCGFVQLSGLGSAQQPFSGKCSLVGADQAEQVTGLAAITFDCNVPGCDANPKPPSPNPNVTIARSEGQKETGDAARIFGLEAHPLLAVEPAETLADVNECKAMSVTLTDQVGQPMSDQNIDVQLPADGHTHYCDLPDGSTWTVLDTGGHIEANTPADGKLVFGITSANELDSTVTAWLDRAENDVLDPDEFVDTSTLHWVAPHSCTIVGTANDETLRGTPGDDRICGLGGDDVIKAFGGRDVLLGGPGSDDLYGGAGRDALRGGTGDDRLYGGTGAGDSCRQGKGDDRSIGCEKGRANQKVRGRFQ